MLLTLWRNQAWITCWMIAAIFYIFLWLEHNSSYFLLAREHQSLVLFATVPESSINSCVSWFIFNLWKINTNFCYESNSVRAVMARIDSRMLDKIQANYNANAYRCNTTMHDSQCTYLNSGLLVAPREYVLHGLVPGIDWTPSWPILMSMYLVATPNPVFNCLWQRFRFHPNVLCYLGGFSLMYT
jgi:hypothetical protein